MQDPRRRKRQAGIPVLASPTPSSRAGSRACATDPDQLGVLRCGHPGSTTRTSWRTSTTRNDRPEPSGIESPGRQLGTAAVNVDRVGGCAVLELKLESEHRLAPLSVSDWGRTAE